MAVNASESKYMLLLFVLKFNTTLRILKVEVSFSDCMTVFECTSLRLLLSFNPVSTLSAGNVVNVYLRLAYDIFLFFHNFIAYVDLNM